MDESSIPGIPSTFDQASSTPDAGIASMRPEWQYGLLQQVILPLVDAAVAMTENEEDQLRMIFSPLIKYGQTCIRRQNGWLTNIVQTMLMEARSNVGQSTSELSNIQQTFDHLASTTPSVQATPSSPSTSGSLSSGQEQGPASMVSPLLASVPPDVAGLSAMPPVPGQPQPPSSLGQYLQDGRTPTGLALQPPGQAQGLAQAPGPLVPGMVQQPDARQAVGGVGGGQAGCPPPVVNLACPPPLQTINVFTGGPGQGPSLTVVTPAATVGPKPGEEELPPQGPQFDEGKTPLVAAPAGDGGGQGGAGGEGALPAPWVGDFAIGSDRICETVEQMVDKFSKIGLAVLDLYNQALLTFAEMLKFPGAFSFQFDPPVPGGQGMRRIFDQAMATRAINQAGAIIQGQLVRGSEPLVGIWAVRSMLDTIDNLAFSSLPSLIVSNVSFSFRFGMKQLDQLLGYLENYVLQMQLPSPGDVEEQYLKGYLTADQARCYWRLAGVSPDVQFTLAHLHRQQLDEFTLTREWFRFFRPIDTLAADFHTKGWRDPEEAKRYVRANEFIPPPTDMINWTVREVFSTVDIGNAEVIAEYNAQVGLSESLRLSGVVPLTFKPENPGPLTELLTKHAKAVPWLTPGANGEINMNVPMMYWAAHYDHASPNQAYEMLFRLRPNRVNRYPLKDEQGKVSFPEPFDIDGVRSLLRLKDYHPIWRDRLAAIAYRPLGRIDTRRIYASGGFGAPQGKAGFNAKPDGTFEATGPAEKEIVEQYKDQGYADIDASRLAMFTAQEFDNKDIGGRKAAIKKEACKSFKAGIIGRERFMELLAIATIPIKEATILYENCEAQLDYETAIEGIKSVRKMFLRGMVDASTANGYLAQIGVLPERRTRYILNWSIDLKGRQKQIPASEMCKWYEEGLISIDEMRSRLLNIGYTPEDAARVIRHCQIGQAAKGAKAAEARAKAAARLEEKTLSKRTPKIMIEWWNAGLIDTEAVYTTLRRQGWNDTDAKRFITASLDDSKRVTTPKVFQEEKPPEA